MCGIGDRIAVGGSVQVAVGEGHPRPLRLYREARTAAALGGAHGRMKEAPPCGDGARYLARGCMSSKEGMVNAINLHRGPDKEPVM